MGDICPTRQWVETWRPWRKLEMYLSEAEFAPRRIRAVNIEEILCQTVLGIDFLVEIYDRKDEAYMLVDSLRVMENIPQVNHPVLTMVPVEYRLDRSFFVEAIRLRWECCDQFGGGTLEVTLACRNDLCRAPR